MFLFIEKKQNYLFFLVIHCLTLTEEDTNIFVA